MIFSDFGLYSIADVVYDSSIIPSLVRVLKILLRKATSNPRMAIIASTVRNRQTRDEFLTALGKGYMWVALVKGVLDYPPY